MKKLLALVLTVLTVLALAGCGGSGPKKMVIGLDDNFAPMGFRDKDNKIVGFDIDLAREAAKRAGMEVEFKPIDWSAKEAELNGKRIDAIWNCFTINPEREKVIHFSKPYIDNAQVVAVPAKSTCWTANSPTCGKAWRRTKNILTSPPRSSTSIRAVSTPSSWTRSWLATT